MTVKKYPGSIAVIALVILCVPLQALVEFPLIQSMAYFPFSADPPPEASRFTLTLETHYSNIYAMAFDQEVANDFEMFSALLAGRYGISDRTFVEMYYRFFYVHGGFFDGIIEDFHGLLGLSLGGRDAAGRNEVDYRYPGFFQYGDSTGGSSPLLISLGHTLLKSPTTRLVGRLFAGIPVVSKPGFVSDKPFFGAGLMLDTQVSLIRVHLSAHLAAVGEPEWLEGEPLHSTVFHSNLELAYRRLKLGFALRTSPFKSGDPGHNGHQIYLGYRIARWLEAGFVEDLPPFDTTLDVGIYLKFYIL